MSPSTRPLLPVPDHFPFPRHPQQQRGQLWRVQSIQRFLPRTRQCAPQVVSKKFLQEKGRSNQQGTPLPILPCPTLNTGHQVLSSGTSYSPHHLFSEACSSLPSLRAQAAFWKHLSLVSPLIYVSVSRTQLTLRAVFTSASQHHSD